MTDANPDEQPKKKFQFVDGGKDREPLEWPKGGETARKVRGGHLPVKRVAIFACNTQKSTPVPLEYLK